MPIFGEQPRSQSIHVRVRAGGMSILHKAGGIVVKESPVLEETDARLKRELVGDSGGFPREVSIHVAGTVEFGRMAAVLDSIQAVLTSAPRRGDGREVFDIVFHAD